MDDKVALVTGGSRGIGRAISERLARDGAVVAVAYARDDEAARDTVDGIRKHGGRAFAIHAKLGGADDAARLWEAFDAASGQYVPDGKLDILVHNAAAGQPAGLASLSEEDFDHIFAVNVKAPMFITKQALPRLRDGGRIINISSAASRLSRPGLLAYSASKGALDVFTRALATEVGPRGITVNAVSPAVILTDNHANLRTDEAAAEAEAARTALGRIGQPEDVADIVGFIASDDARWVTGRIIDASGGSTL